VHYPAFVESGTGRPAGREHQQQRGEPFPIRPLVVSQFGPSYSPSEKG
jgi:hypothetical protein